MLLNFIFIREQEDREQALEDFKTGINIGSTCTYINNSDVLYVSIYRNMEVSINIVIQ